jgi:phosphatidylserine/phosphatidylglycerophosphate/cardiolipin synthase-like enzyme
VEGIEEDDEPASGTGRAAISFGGISPCTAIHEGWYIQDGLFATDPPALDRLRVLRKRGITCFAVRQTCLESDKTGVYVFLDKKITDEATANQTASNYGLALERYGLLERRLMVRRMNGGESNK